MEDNIDAFDEEVESLENEEEVAEEPSKTKGKVKKPVEAEAPTEKYVAVHQREIIGIADTITGELVIELPDLTQAKLEAIKLNKLDKMEVAIGVNS